MNPSLPRCLATSLDGSSEWDNHANLVKVTRVGQALLPPYPPSVYEHQLMPRYSEPSQAQYYFVFGGPANTDKPFLFPY